MTRIHFFVEISMVLFFPTGAVWRFLNHFTSHSQLHQLQTFLDFCFDPKYTVMPTCSGEVFPRFCSGLGIFSLFREQSACRTERAFRLWKKINFVLFVYLVQCHFLDLILALTSVAVLQKFILQMINKKKTLEPVKPCFVYVVLGAGERTGCDNHCVTWP